MWKCPKCGSEEYDLFEFMLPGPNKALLISIPLITYDKGGLKPYILSDKNKDMLAKLLNNYRKLEVYVCKECGYTELKLTK
jgi:predicted nucleic-acid-binding Zn-ribbon protein